MLLGFRCKNFKTYYDDTVFSMEPNLRQKDMKDSILTTSIEKKTIHALSTSVIYGPNASGKTNIIGAMDFLRCLILSGNVQNIQKFDSLNSAVWNPSLIPNRNSVKEPVSFEVEFVVKNLHILYSLKVDMGSFRVTPLTRKHSVVSESLEINWKTVFSRTEKNLDVNPKPIENFRLKGFPDNDILVDIARENIQPDDLFLTNGFRSMISGTISEIVQSWFRNDFCTFFGSHQIHSFPNTLAVGKVNMPDSNLQQAIENFGIHQNQIGILADEKLPVPLKVTLLPLPGFDEPVPIPSEIYESLGTLRFLDIFPLLMDAFAKGKTLIFDEFDASIHPSALKNIICAFHNNEVNTNHAQLIFNTHNPIFLDSSIFRRDEIKFVDRDETTGNSDLYQLSDFKTNGENSARKTNAYLKNYFVHRYGAIRDIDFTSQLQNAAQKNERNDL